MLIINNGVPKSGTTWIHKVVRSIKSPDYPSSEWRNEWVHPSVNIDRLKCYVDSGEWKNKPTLIKMHVHYNPSRAFLKQGDIKIIVTYRNLADSVLSYFHHEVRKENLDKNDLESWSASKGIEWAKNAASYRKSWIDFPGALLLKYEESISSPEQSIIKIADFVGSPINMERANDIYEKHRAKKVNPEKLSNESHIRTAGLSRGEAELPPSVFQALRDLETGLGEA